MWNLYRPFFPKLLLPLAAALLFLGGSATAAPPTVSKLVSCVSSAKKSERYAVFSARASAPEEGYVEISFGLEQRNSKGGGTFIPVTGPELGTWKRSIQGAKPFKYTKRVTNLEAAVFYRAVVKYRWYDSDGNITAEAERRTPSCRQRDLRPNLIAQSLKVTDSAVDRKADYAFTVVRGGLKGKSTAKLGKATFDVVLRINGVAQPVVTLSTVKLGSKVSRTTTALRCQYGESLELIVDPDDRIEESNEGDNVFTLPCLLTSPAVTTSQTGPSENVL